MKISVVTAVYNRARTLGQAMKSVAEQDYGDIEHVLQDGGSTDGTLDVIEANMSPRVVLRSAPDAGLYDAINQGITRASGDIIGLMHSDDFFADTSVLSQVAKAFEDHAVDGVYGDLDYVAEEEPTRVIRRWRSGEYSADKLRAGWMPPHPTLYLRREIYETWGLYDTSFDIAADYDAMLRYLHKGGIRLHYVPHVFVKMRMGGASNKSIGRILKKSREDYRALRGNGVGGFRALAQKNLSKVSQFF